MLLQSLQTSQKQLRPSCSCSCSCSSCSSSSLGPHGCWIPGLGEKISSFLGLQRLFLESLLGSPLPRETRLLPGGLGFPQLGQPQARWPRRTLPAAASLLNLARLFGNGSASWLAPRPTNRADQARLGCRGAQARPPGGFSNPSSFSAGSVVLVQGDDLAMSLQSMDVGSSPRSSTDSKLEAPKSSFVENPQYFCNTGGCPGRGSPRPPSSSYCFDPGSAARGPGEPQSSGPSRAPARPPPL